MIFVGPQGERDRVELARDQAHLAAAAADVAARLANAAADVLDAAIEADSFEADPDAPPPPDWLVSAGPTYPDQRLEWFGGSTTNLASGWVWIHPPGRCAQCDEVRAVLVAVHRPADPPSCDSGPAAADDDQEGDDPSPNGNAEPEGAP